MSKTVLIVEKDLALMRTVAQSLTGRGVHVEESTDGKGSPELIRRTKPDCVVLAVDLDAGQNGYILCKKLKSDDELKGIPVIIIGDPKGFAQHQKLKTRAEDYVGKPLAVDQLVDAIGRIIVFDPVAPVEEANGSFDPGSMVEQDSYPVEEVALDGNTGETTAGAEAADFDMVDAMFDESKKPAPLTELSDMPLGMANSDFEGEERTVVGFMPPGGALKPSPLISKPSSNAAQGTTKVVAFNPAPVSPLQYSSSPSGLTGSDGVESRDLRSKVTELAGSLEESQRHATELENKIRELEADIESKQTELETARTGANANSKSDKDVFALRDSVNKKDKEILRLKSELNDKEKEIVELREKENALDQQVSESASEIVKLTAQGKTLQTKADQLGIEKKRVDTQLTSAKEESRATAAKLSTLQGDFETLQTRNGELEGELEPLRAAHSDLEAAKARTETELSEARGEIDSLRGQVEERQREVSDLHSQLELSQQDLEAARQQVNSQAQAFADEIAGLRQRVSELETETQEHAGRAARSSERVKAHEEQAERVRQALQMAMGHLEQQPGEVEELEIDEVAEA